MIPLRIVHKKKSLLSKMSEIFDKMSIHSGSSNATVAVCQMTSGQDKDKNFNCVENLVKLAVERNASVSTLLFANLAKICELTNMLLIPDGIPARGLRLHL